ncbi:PspA/IM30 family protein [Paenibacillus alkalitolerans]|uniref:PspA/IM30 family protein n=1 Tax=Paenibacillus alkalitolerans TaxID=2799335 RepID=UPI0018F76E0C|nr:PspA/IM30 family protein [Paenibacillus alkalitolerans]
MGIFKRLRDISLSSIHELLNKAEDPVMLMNQYIRDMESELSEAEVAFAKQVAAEKRAQHQLEEAAEMVVKREQGAIQALQAGDEALARQALEDKKTYEAKAEVYKTQYESAKSLSDQLRSQLHEMKSEYERMKQSRDELVARAEAAKTQKKLNETLSSFGKASAVKEFDRMKEKVLELEAHAEASSVLKNENRNLDQKLNALNTKSEIDDELARLKKQIQDGENS